MSVTSLDKDFDNLVLTLVADFDAPVDQVWELWADPRKLERWWGPPGYPSTVEKHDFSPGGEVTYFMTSPEGQKHYGWWEIDALDPPSSLEFTDGFADDDGQRLYEPPPNKVRVTLREHEGGTRMELRSSFSSKEHMQQLIDMGAAEGMKQSIGQMDALLA